MTALVTTGVGTATLFRRACAAEWTRLWTVRSTWGALLAAAVAVVGVGALLGADAADSPAQDWPPAFQAGEMGLLIGQFALVLLPLLAVCAEYASGAIRPTLQWTPSRSLLLGARTVVQVAVVAAAAALLAVAGGFAAWLAYPGLELSAAAGAATAARGGGVAASVAVLTVGVAFALRGTGATLAAVFLLLLVLPFMLPAFGPAWLSDLALHLPGSAVAWVLVDDAGGLTAAEAVALLVAWPVAALVVGGMVLARRDAD